MNRNIWNENICLFVPHNKDFDTIHTINFVLETKPQECGEPRTQAVYKMYYVCAGEGIIRTAQKETAVKTGDVFFTFPGVPFSIESKTDFSYMYISFLGTRANMIFEKLKINRNNFVFKNCHAVGHIWKYGISISNELSDLISESVLLYTFTHIGTHLPEFNKKNKPDNELSLYIKKIIEDNFSDPNFSLETVSRELSYNKKYLSFTFKKDSGIGISEYLNNVRIQNACVLMRQGFTSVSDIAHSCGFSDPQYFSKVFKKQLSVTPMQYIKGINA